MHIERSLATLALAAALAARVARADTGPDPDAAAAPAYAPGGVATCVECHDETDAQPVFSIFKTPHAVVGDPRAPFAGQGCQACHGPSAAHVKNPRVPPPVTFKGSESAVDQNRACLACHAGGERMNWAASRHDAQGVGCVACHDIHGDADRVLAHDRRPTSFARRNTQAEVCFTCHAAERAQIQRMSAHPLRDGNMECSDCHNPHGSAGPASLREVTVNETCYRCHADKRGPFLWEHAPVREQCTTCHTPHGSSNVALLRGRLPFLCQECHLSSRHPSTLYDGAGTIAQGGAASKQLGLACVSCHVEIHGSNHPSGVHFTR